MQRTKCLHVCLHIDWSPDFTFYFLAPEVVEILLHQGLHHLAAEMEHQGPLHHYAKVQGQGVDLVQRQEQQEGGRKIEEVEGVRYTAVSSHTKYSISLNNSVGDNQ